ncbi:hypothetical protein AACH10_16915 [Ideonella sp. DXS22W]|uniref:Peptidase S8/S53 domain-containing protein n=1 Tax=Pseudaquabacterium inlustre TaxID=2984192 RepID=A0ABU9CJK0_9BURK
MAAPAPTVPQPSAIWAPGSAAAARPRDPYLRWAELSAWRPLMPGGRLPAQLSFVVERSADSPGWDAVRSPVFGAEVPAAYDEPLPGRGTPSRFATLRIATALPGQPTLPPPALAARVAGVLGNPAVARLQLGYPRGAATSAPGAPAGPVRPLTRPAAVVLGVIDYGCPFAHAGLLDATGTTRVAALWQCTTRDVAQPPWQLPPGFTHGRMLGHDALQALLDAHRIDGAVDEARCYETAYAVMDTAPASATHPARRWLKPSRALLSRASHGSGVLALAAAPAAGLVARWPAGLPPAEQPPAALHAPPGDVASRSPLLVVDLPREQSEVSSGRWLPVNALDGLRFITAEARSRFHWAPADGAAADPAATPPARLPVVVNLSSGAHAAARAGQAMFERAMDELLQADEHLAITLAAGNSRLNASHAALEVPAGGWAELGLFVPPAQPFDSCVELWLPPGTALDQVAIEVTAPDGTCLRVDGRTPEMEWRCQPDQPCAALLLYSEVVQATDRPMALLAIWGTTSSVTRQAPAPAGPWLLRVRQGGDGPLAVSAWIECDEVIFGRVRPQSARFFNPQRCAADERPQEVAARVVRRDDTLSNVATGALTLAVAAYTGRRDDGPVSGYSGMPGLAAGAGGLPQRWLPLAAAADAGISHPGMRLPGNRRAVLQRFNGTSAAAPQAARHVANQMATGLTRSSLVAALPATPAPTPVPPDWLRHPAEPPLGPGPLAAHPADGRLRVP